MKRIFFKALIASCLVAAAAPMAVWAQSAQNLGLTRVSAAEVARVHGLTADYVRTPNGYFHASCVQHVDQSEQLQADGNIRRADGNVRQVAACSYPHFLNSGVRVEATDSPTHLPVVYNGYLQLVSATLASGTGRLTAYMKVPPNPTIQSLQTLYFFPGLEDGHNVVTILQPVLGWNGYGANNWTIASWNCCKSGTTYVGNNVVVQSGDKIYGTMIRTGGQNWTITATDQTHPALPSAVLATNGYNQVFDWIFAGALETYGVTGCNQFPRTGPIAFTNVQVFLGGKAVSNPAWSVEPGTDKETACTGATIVDSKNVNISY
ncbi:MAG TPA: hypothetical protein VGH80_04660 [Xanthomonadaceae bacterium]|jgi:hypothetical protein